MQCFKEAAASADRSTMEEILLARCRDAGILQRCLRRHRQMPMALGSGATSLEHKLRCLATKFAHEAQTMDHLRTMAARVRSFTVDMGTEMGVSDACGGDITSYLPTWMQGEGSSQMKACNSQRQSQSSHP